MPLLKGSSKSIVSQNIRELRKSGKKEDQAVAISLSMSRKEKAGSGLSKKGKRKPLQFKEGGLHESTDTAPNEKISASAHEKAKSGSLGTKAKKQEMFYENVLKK